MATEWWIDLFLTFTKYGMDRNNQWFVGKALSDLGDHLTAKYKSVFKNNILITTR